MSAGGPALIDVSHWASEWLWLEVAAEQLRAALPGVDRHGQRTAHRPLGLRDRLIDASRSHQNGTDTAWP